jgi:hypothetical protein
VTIYGIGPRRHPQSDGNAVPTGNSDEACEQREELRDQLAGQTLKPPHTSPREHDRLIDDKMRTMRHPDRVFAELEMRERRGPMHEVDYDPLPYNYNGYDPLPVDVGPMGHDNWGADFPRPQSSPVVRRRGWYDRR